MSFSAKITGTAELLKNIEKADKEMVAILSKELLKGALIVERDAKKLCPVLTGRLRSSITFTQPKIIRGNLVSKVGTNVEYGPDVEHGTQHQRAQPYLLPALKTNQRTIQGNIKKEIKKYTGKGKI